MKSGNAIKRRQARVKGIFGKRKTSSLLVFALVIFVSVCNIGMVLYKNLNKEHWVLVFVNDNYLHLNQSINEGKSMMQIVSNNHDEQLNQTISNVMQNLSINHDEQLNQTISEEHLHLNQSINVRGNVMQNVPYDRNEKLNQSISEEHLHLNQSINEGGNVMQNVPYDHNVCPSPERDVPWIFDGTCEERPLLSTFSSLEVTRSCGFVAMIQHT